MSKYRTSLPLGKAPLMSDGGLETTLVFHEGMELPEDAAFDLLRTHEGVETLRRYYEGYARIARRHSLGMILESPTWRANPDWAARIGYDAAALAVANRKAIELMNKIRAAWETPGAPYVTSGNVGPRGDGYFPECRMSSMQARDYHAQQIETFAETDADMIAAFTLEYPEEAAGIVAEARECALPAVISFTVREDGRLPGGETLADAIASVDDETDGYVAYYMLNCAHPLHFCAALEPGGAWLERVQGFRANASRHPHTEFDTGDPAELGREYLRLQALLPRLAVVGGCCGTDERHIEAICNSLVPCPPVRRAGQETDEP
jgi:S-methylmethionine-dependent homocysteine/selenocysteine methylase